MTQDLTIDHMLGRRAPLPVATHPCRERAGDLAAEPGDVAGQAQATAVEPIVDGPVHDPIPQGVWPAAGLGRHTAATFPTGWPALDAELPGDGWPSACVIEILCAQSAVLEWRLVASALARAAGTGPAGHRIVLVGPPRAPHAPGLEQVGIDPARLVWIRAQAPSERLWVAEQYARSSAASVLAWLPQALPPQLRRLQVCAQHSRGLLFVFRPLSARREPSAASLRLVVEVRDDWCISVDVIKRRGPPMPRPVELPACPGRIGAVLSARTHTPSRLDRRLPRPSVVFAPALAHALGSPPAPFRATGLAPH